MEIKSFWCLRKRFTFAEAFKIAAKFGNALINAGIKKGDKVSICMQNNPEFMFAYMGIVGIGAFAFR